MDPVLLSKAAPFFLLHGWTGWVRFVASFCFVSPAFEERRNTRANMTEMHHDHKA